MSQEDPHKAGDRSASDNSGLARGHHIRRVTAWLVLVGLFLVYDAVDAAPWTNALMAVVAGAAVVWLTGSILAVAITIAVLCIIALTDGREMTETGRLLVQVGAVGGTLAAAVVLGQRFRAAMAANRARRAKVSHDARMNPADKTNPDENANRDADQDRQDP